MTWTIWHNPRCRKSRETLTLLQENGIEPSIREYLKDTATKAELEAVLVQLGMTPHELLRSKETLARELGLKGADDASVLAAMLEHPKLIERPIVIYANKAVLGRPPENVLSLL